MITEEELRKQRTDAWTVALGLTVIIVAVVFTVVLV